MFLALLAGCALSASRTGLVRPEGDRVLLETYEGRRVALTLDAEAEPVRYLEGCVVVVEGPRLGKRVWVKDWYVQDAGDGSSGFVGLLRRHGSNLVIDDRNTGTTLRIEDVSAARLRGMEGRTVLLLGHVVGGGIVEVVGVRVLEGDEAADGDGRPPG